MNITNSRNRTRTTGRRSEPLNLIRRFRKALSWRKVREAEGFTQFFVIIVTLTLAPVFFGFKVAGFSLAGWSWVFALVFSLWRLSCVSTGRVAFPVRIWAPWCAVLAAYLVFTARRLDAVHTAFQMLTPIAVGCAASTFRPPTSQLRSILPSLDKLAWVVSGLVLATAALKFGGALPTYGFMLMPVVFSLVLASLFAGFYASGSKRHIWYYTAMAALPVFCYVRGPIMAASASLLLTPAPLGKNKRLAACGMVLLAGVLLFYTPRFQARMFRSGHGSIEELRSGVNDPNLQTSGRSAMWDFLWAGFKDRPWLGHGLNQSRSDLLDAGFPTYLPHNDWLKLLYEFGILGTACYFLAMLLQALRLRLIGSRASGDLRILAYGAAGTFVPFAVMMFTDNVILYVQFFCNLQFCMIGFIYGHLRFRRAQKASIRREQLTRVQCSNPPLQQAAND